ncbi:heme-containing dehydratase protein [Aspergillus pseudoustus]|uniref:Heme-containing dehydratase protein n=1 Tax=Aspergillus pseudoustus TaxID=1810923 RepID=A0ABR4JH60_9EURO
MWGVKLPPSTPVVYSVFGIQYPPEKDDNDQELLIQRFTELITDRPRSLEILVQDTPVPTRIWLAYWQSPAHFDEWWTSEPVSSYWASLADDAGIYREILTVLPGVTQHGTNNGDRVSGGLSHLGEFESILDKSGYWGCYYDRMADVTKENRFPSPLSTKPSRNLSPLASIRSGRVSLPDLPDNILFVIEGQDHSYISPEEKSHWLEHFDKPVETWIDDLVAAGPEKGVLDVRVCYDPNSGMYRAADAEPRALNFNRKAQLFYFLDMEAMERIARENAGHVKLRRKFLQDYGPGGVMGQLPAALCMWVEASILKGRNVECEYVGCLEGTGLMGLNWR